MRWVQLLQGLALPVMLVAVARRGARRRVERAVADRLGPLDADGVVAGAAPIALDGGPRAALLLHGFGDTPESLGGLARFLQARGWTVRVPLLPGHGRSVRAFERSSAAAWEDAAEAAYAELAARGQPVALVGQSMGAALAVRLAAQHAEAPVLVLLAPLLSLSRALERGARWWWLVALVRPLMESADERSILDPEARARARGYGILPVRLVPQLVGLVRAACAALPRVRQPVRVIQSREDNRVTPAGTEAALRTIGSREVELCWRGGAGHVVSVDYGHEEVWVLVADWLERQTVAAQARTA
jgi:carboxylesterase